VVLREVYFILLFYFLFFEFVDIEFDYKAGLLSLAGKTHIRFAARSGQTAANLGDKFG